jgi:uncharacterized protein
MSRDFPDWVHPDKAAAARREFAGSVPVERMARLAGLIVEGRASEINFRLAFAHNELNQVRVDVEISGHVPMKCQRSLRVFDQELRSASVVGVVSTEDEVDGLPGDYEPLVCADNRLNLLDMVEEEILLGLPLVPVDPASSRIGAEPATADTHRPFEALAALKKDRDKDI